MVERSRVRPSSVRASALAFGVALLAACAPPAATPGRSPAHSPAFSARDVDAVARLMQLEDARHFREPVLSEAAASANPQLRARAALALGRLRRPEGAAVLETLLLDSDSSVAATAAFSLGLIGDSAAVPLLVPLLDAATTHARPTVASEAAYALGRLGSTAAHDALVTLLSAPRQAPGDVVASALLAVWRFPLPTDVGPIVRWTSSPDPELRWRAVYALTRRPTPAATAALLPLAGDPSPLVRAAALRGLVAPMAEASGMGRDAALPVVLASATDSAYVVRVAAIRALGSYRDAGAVRALVSQLTSGERHAALASAEALAQVGAAAAQAAPALRSVALADSAHLALRQAALAALAAVEPPSAVEIARQWSIRPEWRLRAAAARALGRSDSSFAAELGRLVRDPDGRVAASALEAVLERSGDNLSRIRGLLIESLGSPDPWVRATALRGLARLRDPATLPAMLDAYQRASADSTHDAALAAIEAIASLAAPGLQPQRTFFARFGRSPDYLVRLRVRQHFGAAADSAWGDPLPVETGRSEAEYRSLAEGWISARDGGGALPEVEIATDAGRLRLRLFAADAPLTVESFTRLAERGYFDGQEWPRVVPNFVVQGGDPRGDTNGGPGYALRDEINRHRYGTGALGMALSGPDTGGSQFFVTHSPQPHLDGTYAIFGEVVGGQAVAEAILPGDRIHSIRVLR